MKEFLDHFKDPNSKAFTYLQVGEFSTPYIPYIPGLELPDDKDVFFTPAYRRKKDPKKKESVAGTMVLWADVDHTRHLPECAFKPSMIVDSGHGYHLYWLLEKPVKSTKQIEKLNGIIRDTMQSDSVQNANRILRVPGTTNNKHLKDDQGQYDAPVPVELKRHEPTIVYRSEDFLTLKKMTKRTKHIVRTGDSRNFESRSERDWAAVTGLVKAGASSRLIHLLFDHQPVGDKAREGNGSYLDRTITQAKASVTQNQPRGRPTRAAGGDDGDDGEQGIAGLHEDKDNSAYLYGYANHTKRVSTFLIEPKVILRDTAFDEDRTSELHQDVLIADVTTLHEDPYEMDFHRSVFNSARAFKDVLRYMNWSWLASDRELNDLLPHLMERVRAEKVPIMKATPVQGLHYVNGKWLFLTNAGALTSSDYYEGNTAEIVWMPIGAKHKRETPEMLIQLGIDDALLAQVGSLLPGINLPHVIWPMIGWFSASTLKPWIEKNFYRFPLLNITGMQGSGKTATLERVLLKLFGNQREVSYRVDSREFSRLVLLSSTNAIPISYGEYRLSNNGTRGLDQDLRMLYDSGRDLRGRSDQTTQSYDLLAPVVVSGEDSLAHDPALKQRIVLVRLLQSNISEQTTHFTSFKELQTLMPSLKGYAAHHIQSSLRAIESGKAADFLQEAAEEHKERYKSELPDRIRNNQIITYFGIKLFCDFVGIENPGLDVLEASLTGVFNMESGRDNLLVDDFVVDIVNKSQMHYGGSQFNKSFDYFYDQDINTLYFQFSPCYSWWANTRSRSQRAILAEDSILQQLRECPYFTGVKKVANVLMYGIQLKVASELGMDLPSAMKKRGPTLRGSASSHNGRTASSEAEEDMEQENASEDR